MKPRLIIIALLAAGAIAATVTSTLHTTIISSLILDGSLATSDVTTNHIVANYNSAISCSGTDYSITTTLTNCTFGTTSPSIVIPSAGTYLVNVGFSGGGSATAGDEFVFQLYDVTNGHALGIAGHFDQPASGDHDYVTEMRFYTATNSGTIWLQIANNAGTRGTVISTNTSIRYIRLN